MKTLLLSVMLFAFAVAAQAGDPNACSMGCCQGAKGMSGQASCCSKGKAEQTKAKSKANSANTVAKRPLASPKAISLACR